MQNKKQDDEFAAFDSVMALPDEEFAAFDQAQKEDSGPGVLDKIGERLSQDVDTATDIARGTAQGATMGFADEIAAGANRLLDPLISRLSGEAAVDEQLRQQGFDVQNIEPSYEQELERTRGMFKESEERSPWLYGGAQIAGSIPSGQMLGGLLGIGKVAPGASRLTKIATEAAKAAPGVALETLGQSEGSLLGDELQREQAIEDTKSGLGIGLVAGAGMQAASDIAVPALKQVAEPIMEKVDEFVAGSPFLRQMGRSVEYGEQGINPVSEKSRRGKGGKPALALVDTQRAESLMKEIMDADKKLGEGISNSLEVASKLGQRIDAYPILQKSLKSLGTAYDLLEEAQSNPRGRYILNKIANSVDKTLDPLEAKALLDDVDAYIGKFGATKEPSNVEKAIMSNLQAFRKNLSNTMKDQIDGYKKAAERFENFRRFVPESLMAADLPTDIADVYMGDLKNAPKDLTLRLRRIIKGANKGGSSSEDADAAFLNFINGIKEFEAAELSRGTKSPLLRTSDEYDRLINEYSDDAAVRRQMSNVEEMSSIHRNLPAALMDTGSTWRAGALTGANLYGRAKKGTQALSRKVFSAPKEQLLPFAQRLEDAGFGTLGTSLREAVENNDSYKRNAALFTILQNPNARLLLTEDEEE